MKKVTTFDGTVADRSECRYIGGQFYIMHKQCIKMPDNKWHRINNGLIIYDNRNQEWVFNNKVILTKGIIDIKENGEYVFGYFSKNPLEDIILSVSSVDLDKYSFPRTYLVLNEEILEKGKFIEELSTGYFYKESDISKVSAKAKKIRNNYSFRLYYSFEHLYPKFNDNFHKYFNYQSTKNKFFEELKDITFGVEFETYNGIIPERHVLKSGLIPLRDGSLRHGSIEPFEYTTIPLKGEKGLHALNRHSELLNKYCTNSLDGSLHIHVGNINVTEKYILSLFKVLTLIEEEIYALFPEYYIRTSKFKSTGKDYCNPLPDLPLNGDINKDLETLFLFYSGLGGGLERPRQITIRETEEVPLHDDPDWIDLIEDNEEDNEEDTIEITKKPSKFSYYIGMPHPFDATFDRKWSQSMRYRWCNFIPLLFNNRRTIEFRIHPPTFNSDKVLNWLFIVVGICRFADENQNTISSKLDKLTLEEIFSRVYSNELFTHLSNYINYRKEMVKSDSIKGDKIGRREWKTDDLKDFNSNIKSLL